MIAVLKCITLFFEFNLLTYLVMSKGKWPVEFMNTSKLGSIWFHAAMTGLLSVPTFIFLVTSLFMKNSLCVRFTLMILYMLESLAVMTTPIFLGRALFIKEEWVLLAVTGGCILILYPLRILTMWTVRGFYRELSFITHNKEVEQAEIEEWKGKLRFCDECVSKYGTGEKLLEVADDLSARQS